MIQLPEDILHRIHAIMSMQDAARAACVSHGFLRSWRCFPKLTLHTFTLGINENASKDEKARHFISRVDNIMQNHTGTGLKMFKLSTHSCSNLHPSYVDRWLQVAIVPGIQEFVLQMARGGEIEYEFLCSLLSSERGRSIQSFFLSECSFHSVAQVGRMSSLTSLHLSSVHITEEQLCVLLSNSCSLEQLRLTRCDDIICLRIPDVLLQLNLLHVMCCDKLEMIESNAPKLSAFNYYGGQIHISLGASLHVRRRVYMTSLYESGMLCYASAKLPSIAPNLQTLYLSTCDEMVNTPMVLGKFLQLKNLEIVFMRPSSPDYDFCSLVSFLDASPALETFTLRVSRLAIRHDEILDDLYGDSSHPRQLSGNQHNKLRNVMITGFCSAKSMIEFTRHIIETTPSLKCLTLDTTRGYDKRYADKCLEMTKEELMKAEKACLAIRRYVEGRVPSTVNLKVVEPCSKCHANNRP